MVSFQVLIAVELDLSRQQEIVVQDSTVQEAKVHLHLQNTAAHEAQSAPLEVTHLLSVQEVIRNVKCTICQQLVNC